MIHTDHLAPLNGSLLRLYRIAGGLLLAVALLIGTVGTYFTDRHDNPALTALYDAGMRRVPSRPGSIAVSAFSDEARAAKMPDGLLVAIDGADVRGENFWSERTSRLLRGSEGSPITVQIEDATGHASDFHLTRSARYLRDAYAGTGITFTGRRWAGTWLSIIGAVMAIITFGVLYLRRPRDPVSALMVTGICLQYVSELPSLLGTVPWPGYLGSLIGVIAFLGGVVLFPAGRLKPRWIVLVLALIVVLEVGASIPLFLGGAEIDFVGHLALLMTLGVVFARFHVSLPGIERQQLKWLTLGVSFFVAGITVQFVLESLSMTVANEGIRAWLFLLKELSGKLGTVAACVVLLFALLRLRLYDVEAAISRSAALTMLTIALLGIFAGTEKVIETVGEQYVGQHLRALAGGIAAGLAAVAVVPLHHRMTRWAENRFQKDLIRLRHDLPVLTADLRETGTPTELAEATLGRVAALMHVTRGAVLFGDDCVATLDLDPEAFAAWRAAWLPANQAIESDSDDPMLPLRIAMVPAGSCTVGWLLLGRRADGSMLGKDEREALTDVAAPLARALVVAHRREAATTATSAIFERIETRVAKLEEVLATIIGKA
ncbi:MAG: hypothetical protein ABI992_03505 [Chthoniobacterales bacterium]